MIIVILYEFVVIIVCWFGLIGVLGIVVELVDGIFIGRLVGEILYGIGKVYVVWLLVIWEGFNFKCCIVYFDSYNDVLMLLLVGIVVVINFDVCLCSLVWEWGWEICDF